jgi:hypothetical protein
MPKQNAPFLKGFSHLLFGSAKKSMLTKLQRLESLDDLYSAFGDLFPAGLLKPTKSGDNSRQRSLPANVTFWAFIAQALSPKSSCREVVRRVEAWWRWGSGHAARAISAGAYCKARQRLPLRTLEYLAEALVHTIEGRIGSFAKTFAGREVKIVDATAFSMPDTPQNQTRWPQPSGQKPGCGFPVAKVVALFSLESGAILAHILGSQAHESVMFTQMWHKLKIGDILLGDRAFCSYGAMAELSHRGVDTVVRLHQLRKTDYADATRLGEGDELVTWHKGKKCPATTSKESFALWPEKLSVRLITTHISAPGFRTKKVIIATTLLDPVAYPADTLRALYAKRWNVELHFDQIKTTLGLDVLTCKHPEMIEKELQIHLIAYNLVRALMQKAALLHDVPLERISFKGSLDTLRHFGQAVHACSRNKLKKQAELIQQMLARIAQDLVPLRPNRIEPRALKRRHKNFQLLNKPRHQMNVIPHRQKYKKIIEKTP